MERPAGDIDSVSLSLWLGDILTDMLSCRKARCLPLNAADDNPAGDCQRLCCRDLTRTAPDDMSARGRFGAIIPHIAPLLLRLGFAVQPQARAGDVGGWRRAGIIVTSAIENDGIDRISRWAAALVTGWGADIWAEGGRGRAEACHGRRHDAGQGRERAGGIEPWRAKTYLR